MAGTPRILVVDDEADLRKLLKHNLARENWTILEAGTGEEAIVLAQAELPNLILLDLMLPGIGGLDVCRGLKADERTAAIPIIMLTAKGEETDIVLGLEMGADDYVTKPFSMPVLIARIRASLRQQKEEQPGPVREELKIHNLVIHSGRRELRVDKDAIPLTYSEFQLLHILAQHPGWVLTRNQIIDKLRGDGYPVTDRSVDVLVVGLRKKLGSMAHVIETVRGVGYRMKEDT